MPELRGLFMEKKNMLAGKSGQSENSVVSNKPMHTVLLI